jgi:hypothetical protein
VHALCNQRGILAEESRAADRCWWGTLRREALLPSQRENRFANVTKARVRQRATAIILRNAYDGITQEPVLGEFLVLLGKIDEAERQRGQPQQKTM